MLVLVAAWASAENPVRAALMRVYEHAGGSEWTHNTGWGSSEPPCPTTPHSEVCWGHPTPKSDECCDNLPPPQTTGNHSIGNWYGICCDGEQNVAEVLLAQNNATAIPGTRGHSNIAGTSGNEGTLS